MSKELQPVKITLEQFSDWLRGRFRQELKDQGHRDTGALEASIDYEVKFEGRTPVLLFYNLDYGEDLETGLLPSQIPTSGAAAANRILDLGDWVRRKGMAIETNDIRTVAELVHRAHTRVGMPTPDSVAFSNNGRRIGWRTYTLEDNKREIETRLEDAITRGLAQTIFEIFATVTRTKQFVYVR